MAKVELFLPDDLMRELHALENGMDEILEEALEAGAEIVYAEVKSSLESIVGLDTIVESRSTGELLDSLGASPVLKNREGNPNIKVGFNEPRRSGAMVNDYRNRRKIKGVFRDTGRRKKTVRYRLTNTMLATIIEYGKHGQPPKPFMAIAKAEAKSKVENVMREIIEGRISEKVSGN